VLEKPRRFYDGFRVYLSDPFDDLLICRLSEGRKAVEPCVIIIFGASGDLTARKLVPALYHLFKEKQMPPAFSVVGVARREKTDASWRTELRSALDRFSRTQPVDEAVWQDFAQHLQYCQGDLTAAATYEALRKRLAAAENELLRRNLLRPESDHIFISGVGYGWKQWWSRYIAPDCCTKKAAQAGNGWLSKNLSGMICPRPGS